MPEMTPRTNPSRSTAHRYGCDRSIVLRSHIDGNHGSTVTNTPRYTQNRTRINREMRCSQSGAAGSGVGPGVGSGARTCSGRSSKSLG